MTPQRAYGLLVASALGFGVMAFLSKLACRTYDGATVAGLRFAIGAVATLGLWATGHVDATPRRWRLLALRGLAGGVAVVLYFLTIEHLDVGLATLLNYTSPTFTVLLARAFLGERVSRGALVALGIAMGGVALVVLGQSSFSSGSPADPFWVGVGLLSAVSSAAAVTAIRALRSGPEPESVWSIFLSFCVVGALCAVPASREIHAPNAVEAALLLGVGLTAMLAQLGMNAVMRWVPAATFGVTAQLSVVFTMLLGVLLLDESWSAVSATGAALTVFGVIRAAR
ncbi:DMT family transporter [Myxococcota bacterium]|nr:DMT family transporter [Myxococcota bacterium]